MHSHWLLQYISIYKLTVCLLVFWIYLFRCLAKVVDESNSSCLLDLIINAMDIYIAFIKQVMEHVVRLYCSWTLLSVAKD